MLPPPSDTPSWHGRRRGGASLLTGLGADAEQGRAQSNALGGSRNNANQGTPRDGLPPTTNMFLWRPQAGSAFPAQAFRPVSPDLNLRQFSIPPTLATALRLRVLISQCTGNPLYAGEQDSHPAPATDCAANSQFRSQVRIAEFQAFTR